MKNINLERKGAQCCAVDARSHFEMSNFSVNTLKRDKYKEFWIFLWLLLLGNLWRWMPTWLISTPGHHLPLYTRSKLINSWIHFPIRVFELFTTPADCFIPITSRLAQHDRVDSYDCCYAEWRALCTWSSEWWVWSGLIRSVLAMRDSSHCQGWWDSVTAPVRAAAFRVF